jgi:hypothetical protein
MRVAVRCPPFRVSLPSLGQAQGDRRARQRRVVRLSSAVFSLLIWILILLFIHVTATDGHAGALPVRALHLGVPSKRDLTNALHFIRDELPRQEVNTLILEFDYNFNFQSRPEFHDDSALGKNETRLIAQACREAHIQLIPQINCLGHQSWAKRNGRFLQKHPEFDETPGKYPDNEGIYCRSYCPLHPEVHKVLFDLIDELADACGAKAFHVGLDEVFILADPDCPRCRGRDPARLFADEVKTLNAHCKAKGRRMWIWGDRLLDGKELKLGKWEGSENGTGGSFALVPKDIVICDWHYNEARGTISLFATNGFDVVACPWRKADVALAQLKEIRELRQGGGAAAKHALGMMQTTWAGFAPFLRAYEAQTSGSPPEKNGASESADCFIKLFKAIKD